MMVPRQVAQGSLFYEFSIEDHVPPDHLLTFIDRFVDLGDVRRHLAPFYSSTGRPCVNPELMIRMLLVGYCFGIRSERRLCEEVHLNLAYRWFCRLDLANPFPTTRRSLRTAIAGSETATCSGISSRRF
jgi:transposase